MQLSLRHPAEIISFLSALTGDHQTGEVLLQSKDQSAKVYLHDGLIVWAFATGQDESFQSILVRENLLSKEKLLEGIRGAREQGKKSLNDILIALGIDDFEQRQRIIERHTRAALRTLQNWENCQAQFNSTSTDHDSSVRGLVLETLLDRSASARPRGAEILEHPASAARKEAPAQKNKPIYKPDLRGEPVASLPEVLERFRVEVPNFIAAMVIDGDTGMPIASASDVENLDLEVVGAFFRNLSKSALDALQAMGKAHGAECPLKEILLTSGDEFALVRTLKGGAHFLYLSIDKNSNPGMARIVIRKYLDDIHRFLA